MYLQITTRCNMACRHCCFSCRPNAGKHMSLDLAYNAIRFASGQDDYYITIGGGEPTLHPNFFEILKRAMDNFESVWLATNGTNTEAMYRLARIMRDDDIETFIDSYPEDNDDDDDLIDAFYDNFSDQIIHNSSDKLSVAISLDDFHDRSLVDQTMLERWASHRDINKFQIRAAGVNGYDKLANVGRAKRNQLTNAKHCACPGLFINPYGNIKLCGCPGTPVIGNVLTDINPKWISVLSDDDYLDDNCYRRYRETKQYNGETYAR